MKKYISIITVFFLAGISGCKKDYLSQEVNPNKPSVSTPQLTLAGAEAAAARIVSTDYSEYGVWAGYWTTSGNYVPNQCINEYQFTNQTFDTQTTGPWIDLYSNLTNFNTLETISSTPANANFKAIALIMKAYDFEQLVDSYNDVPYSQAFSPSTILFPAYDKAIDIYHDLGKQLDAAIALINANTGAANPGSSDIIFGGNMQGWKEFANSIKLRLAIHVSTNFSGDPLITDLATTASEGYLGLDEAIANPGYTKTLSSSGSSQENPFWGDYGVDVNNNVTGNNAYYRANAFAVEFMRNTNDPRMSQFYAPVTGTPATPTFHGNVFGDVSANNLPNPGNSAVGPGLLQSASQGTIMFSGAESWFLQAEAILDGMNIGSSGPADALLCYENGIDASFIDAQAGGTYVPASPGSPQTPGFIYTAPTAATSVALATTYYSQTMTNVGWPSAGTIDQQKEAIIYQKWLALNGYFNLEAYNEYRRTGYPVHPSSIDPAAISPTFPTRIFYPISELTNNGANLAKEGTINAFTSKIFFAK
jgi:hypothetical protein